MTSGSRLRRLISRRVARLSTFLLAVGALGAAACGSAGSSGPGPRMGMSPSELPAEPPSPDPRVGLRPGLLDAGEAIWNMRVVSTTTPSPDFVGVTNSDLAFKDNYVIQGNYNGFQVWDISDPTRPSLVTAYLCPASQSDVSVYQNLLFVSGEGFDGRLDCGTQGVSETVSQNRLRGIRIFDISDIENPEYIANVQTCRGSHTHSVLEDPNDRENVYVYVSGSAPVRPEDELPGCSDAPPDQDPNTAMFRIEVIRVPLADPAQAEIVSSPRIFEGLVAPERHGASPRDIADAEEEIERGEFVVIYEDEVYRLPPQVAEQMLGDIVEERGGSGAPTAADSAALRDRLPGMVQQMLAERGMAGGGDGPQPGPNQCHDITLYPAIGLAGGACEGYGLLLDISDPVNPRRITEVADSNFAYWHSATFNNDGTAILFTDEWGGGGGPKCREGDPEEWGADAIFTIGDNGEMEFQSYYKLSAVQTPEENCVAHNGSLIPIPGRDIMVQGWYQGGISIFDWTDPANPVEIAYHDRGPVNPDQMEMGGSWSVYWYNGLIVNSEIARGLDIFELTPSAHISPNEIEAARTVELEYLNAQGQPQFVWPPSFALARAYVDQLERSEGLAARRIEAVRRTLDNAETSSGSDRQEALVSLAAELEDEANGSSDAERVRMLAQAVRDLAAVTEE